MSLRSRLPLVSSPVLGELRLGGARSLAYLDLAPAFGSLAAEALLVFPHRRVEARTRGQRGQRRQVDAGTRRHVVQCAARRLRLEETV